MAEERSTSAGAGGRGLAHGTPTYPFFRSIRFKLGLTLAVSLTFATALFALFISMHTRGAFLDQAITQNLQLAEVIRRSTRHAMLANRREQVTGIIEAVSRTRGIEKIRILTKEGLIIVSTLPTEIGERVDKTAEACFSCHQAGQPLRQIPGPDRHRIYRSSVGHRVLGTIDVIRNEPACWTAACHAHPERTTVLGVLDIAYSLEGLDTQERRDMLAIGGLAAALVLVIFLSVTFLVRREIYLPLEDLEEGARLVSEGDRSWEIPVRRHDEIGHLATTFNAMTQALGRYERDLEEWAHTLEERVEEKTAALRLAEAKAAHSEKLASVGLLAAGIAHEINNPLTGVLTFAHLVRDRVPPGSPEAEDLDVIIRETKRCAGIIRRLLDFAREKRPEMASADLNLAIRETVQLVEHQVGFQDVTFSWELEEDLPPVWMDANQMKQVIMNIVVNAKEAMEEHGTLAIRTRRLRAAAAARGGPAVEATFSDTGCGIPAADLARVFDPFFTSKEPGKGVGLGLSVSYSIVRAHGGSIEVESEAGKGTTFRIVLPVEGVPRETGGA